MRVNGVVFPLTHIPSGSALLCCDWLTAREYALLANPSTGGLGWCKAREAGTAGVRVGKKENNESMCTSVKLNMATSLHEGAANQLDLLIRAGNASTAVRKQLEHSGWCVCVRVCEVVRR